MIGRNSELYSFCQRLVEDHPTLIYSRELSDNQGIWISFHKLYLGIPRNSLYLHGTTTIILRIFNELVVPMIRDEDKHFDYYRELDSVDLVLLLLRCVADLQEVYYE